MFRGGLGDIAPMRSARAYSPAGLFFDGFPRSAFSGVGVRSALEVLQLSIEGTRSKIIGG
jgi:hypothetical protein